MHIFPRRSKRGCNTDHLSEMQEALTAIYASTKTKVSAAASASYFPIVPLLQAQGAITNAMYSLVVTRLGPQEANNPKTSGGTIPLSPAATLSTGTLTIGNYPAGMTENQFTWSAVPTVTVSSQYVNYGFPASTGNRWTTQMQAVYFNGAKLINSQIQPEAGANYALIDTGQSSSSSLLHWKAINRPCCSANQAILLWALLAISLPK